jgi:A/G-specific adenine glycosylase
MKHGDIEEAGQYFQDFAGRETDIRSALLRWYRAQRRQLPWRGDPPPWSERKTKHQSNCANIQGRDEQPSSERFFKNLRPSTGHRPIVIDLDNDFIDISKPEEIFPLSAYGVWVSEVMLQQTQVEVVIPFWTRWMKRFPTIEILASASTQEVNLLWAGLGFYARAKRLHEGAQYVLARHGGVLPSSVETLQRIPGIGPYTAGAISSIAFGQPAALVDGNVARVFSRLCAMNFPAKSTLLFKLSWKLAHQLVDPSDPGTFNQSLMELGATVCTPTSPLCDVCPIRFACKAHELLRKALVPNVTHFPARPVQKKRRERSFAVAAVTDGSAWMLVRRPPNGLLAGQLEFPSVEIKLEKEENNLVKTLDNATKDDVMHRLWQSMVNDFSLNGVVLDPFEVPLEHIFSHERHVMHIFRGYVTARPLSHTSHLEVFWLSVSEAEQNFCITTCLQKACSVVKIVVHFQGFECLGCLSISLSIEILHDGNDKITQEKAKGCYILQLLVLKKQLSISKLVCLEFDSCGVQHLVAGFWSPHWILQASKTGTLKFLCKMLFAAWWVTWQEESIWAI